MKITKIIILGLLSLILLNSCGSDNSDEIAALEKEISLLKGEVELIKNDITELDNSDTIELNKLFIIRVFTKISTKLTKMKTASSTYQFGFNKFWI